MRRTVCLFNFLWGDCSKMCHFCHFGRGFYQGSIKNHSGWRGRISIGMETPDRADVVTKATGNGGLVGVVVCACVCARVRMCVCACVW